MIEPLLNHLGIPLALAIALVGVALPLAVLGGLLRRGGRRARTRWELIEAARRSIRDLQPGRVAVAGAFRRVQGPSGVVDVIEEEGRCAVLQRDDAAAIADGARVLVVGYATASVDNPLGGVYRDQARAWRIEGDGVREPLLISAFPDLPTRALRTAALRRRLGVALLGTAVAVAVGSAALCFRAAQDDLAVYSDSPTE